MVILGISAYYHDSAACIVREGVVVAAAQEERFTRVKHDSSFPLNAIKFCAEYAGVSPQEICYVVFFEKPLLKFDRIFETYLAFAPRGWKSFARSLPVWVKDKLFQKASILDGLSAAFLGDYDWGGKLLFSEHHLSHAASAFYPSPFNRAAVLTLDGVGEWATGSVAIGLGSQLEIIKEMKFPHSLGLLYSAFTYYLGFKVNSGEYKVMGLAPYGDPKYTDLIESHLVRVFADGSFSLDMSFFDFATDLKMTNNKFDNLFGNCKREPEGELTQKHMDLAASIQKVTEKIVLTIANSVAYETGETNLCLAGGVALNCVANGVLERESAFENIWIQPAAGDAGGAVGAALAVWYQHLGNNRSSPAAVDAMMGSYLGPSFTNDEVRNALDGVGARYRKLSGSEMIGEVAKYLAGGQAIGWMQGRMEFGPRSLGARSILADPRSCSMQKQLNLKVKYRESFRPFAPSVLKERVNEWFEYSGSSPYMLKVARVQSRKIRPMTDSESALFGIDKLNVVRSDIPAVTHVDYSARIQTVHEETNPRYHALISRFYELTGCPVLVNTSFNVRGEPIVCSPTDAFKCFMGTDLDVLVIEDFVLLKADQPANLQKSYENLYELD